MSREKLTEVVGLCQTEENNRLRIRIHPSRGGTHNSTYIFQEKGEEDEQAFSFNVQREDNLINLITQGKIPYLYVLSTNEWQKMTTIIDPHSDTSQDGTMYTAWLRQDLANDLTDDLEVENYESKGASDLADDQQEKNYELKQELAEGKEIAIRYFKLTKDYDAIVHVINNNFLSYKSYDETKEYLEEELSKYYEDSERSHISDTRNPYTIAF